MLQFGPNMHKKGLSQWCMNEPHAKRKTKALIKADQSTKSDHKLSKAFILQKNHYESFSNLCGSFLVKKKGHFQLKTPVKILSTYCRSISIYFRFTIC